MISIVLRYYSCFENRQCDFDLWWIWLENCHCDFDLRWVSFVCLLVELKSEYESHRIIKVLIKIPLFLRQSFAWNTSGNETQYSLLAIVFARKVYITPVRFRPVMSLTWKNFPKFVYQIQWNLNMKVRELQKF